MKRICKICKTEKTISDYYVKKSGPTAGWIFTECKICSTNKALKWEANNKDRRRIRDNEFYAKNREKMAAKKRKYREREDFRDMERESRNKYVSKKMKTDPMFKARIAIRGRNRIWLKNRNFKKGTRELLGCSWLEFKSHIESLFQPGMTWDNHGTYGWHYDHIFPLAKCVTEEDLIRTCHYTNIQPLWAKDNIRKGDSILN